MTDEKGQFVEIPRGPRAGVSDVMVNGEPLELDKTYTLGSTSYYLKEAGDGFTMLTTLPLVQEDVQLDSQALIAFFDYLGADGLEDYADPAGQGRITILESLSRASPMWKKGTTSMTRCCGPWRTASPREPRTPTFGPDESCTRGQMVTFLWRAAGSPEPETTENPFTDVVEDAYYYKAMLWAVENGITEGTSDTTFGPEETVTRDQAVTFLYRAAGSPEPATIENPFTDLVEDAYYYNAVLWAVENDITTGTTTTTFGRRNPASAAGCYLPLPQQPSGCCLTPPTRNHSKTNKAKGPPGLTGGASACQKRFLFHGVVPRAGEREGAAVRLVLDRHAARGLAAQGARVERSVAFSSG